jgi:hypothetical protein
MFPTSLPRSRVLPDFKNPSSDYGLVPFWWWVGEPLERSRLAWQLDRLKEKGVLNAIISYNHYPDGSPNLGAPSVFSEAWWELLLWMLSECKSRGMHLSFQDYTLLGPALLEVGKQSPGMSGGELREVHQVVRGEEECHLQVEKGGRVLQAFAYPIVDSAPTADSPHNLTSQIKDGGLCWRGLTGDWLVSLVFIMPGPFDPLHPQAGAKVIEQFYAPFKTHLKEELGTTFSISFQDELDFGSRMPFWSARLRHEFLERKGYDLFPLLAALWNDLGSVTPKVRIDYGDVVTTLLEESYFIPVFEWHESNGLLFGNDNCARGGIQTGRMYYGDAFRTMRWYSAPGTDDPNLRDSRAYKGIKVNSSISHLYQRPRVWAECFHSSGWGARPEDIVAGLNEDFIYGANLVNLHGLYYTTYGGWWEWASPDFHFRQPYWQHMGILSAYVGRLCQTLTQGIHVCDVAIVYPITSLEAGLKPNHAESDLPFSERQAGKAEVVVDESELHAFGLGRHLINEGIDFDFIDFQSLERADLRDGEIHVSGESYRVLILPAMSAARFSTLEKARDFVRAGGTVIAYGCLPIASERAGSCDPVLDSLVQEIFNSSCDDAGQAAKTRESSSNGVGAFVPQGYEKVVEIIGNAIVRDFDPAGAGLYALHRRTETKDIYFVFNPNQNAIEPELFFRARGVAELWDALTGKQSSLEDVSTDGHSSRLRLRFEPKEARLIVFDRSHQPVLHAREDRRLVGASKNPVLSLDGPWNFELTPTLDNQFGDFRFPASSNFIGAEARRFRYAEETGTGVEDWHLPSFDDQAWPLTTASFGPRFWKLGPVQADTSISALETALAALPEIDCREPVTFGGRAYYWSPYEFSPRWGVEGDPFLKDWASGPHGLKGEVADEFIDLNSTEVGSVWFLWTSVQSPRLQSLPFVMGSRSSYSAYFNGRRVLDQSDALPPGRDGVWNLPHYRSHPSRAMVELEAGDNPLLLKFIQPEGQRVRAYAAFDLSSPPALALRWFNNPAHPIFNFRPKSLRHATWFRFNAPPGLCAMTVVSRGPLEVWVSGEKLSADNPITRSDGSKTFRITVPQPCRSTANVALRIEQPAGSFAGDSLPEPISLECMPGEISLGDWSHFGLSDYSGAASYRRSFFLTADEMTRASLLDFGKISTSADVRINGHLVATLINPPWRISVKGLLREGDNLVEVRVANTLANHYRTGIPTPYFFDDQTVSGLLGPVRLDFASTEETPN